MSKGIKLAAVLATGALALAACGSSSSAGSSGSASPSASKIDFKACMVSDAGGFDDRSFNQTGYEGLKKAEAELGVEVVALESKTDADYTPNINQAVSQGCNLVITVGFLLGDATEKAATANPDTDFAIVDYAYEKPPANLKGLVFATEQSSFLAGIAAAGTTKSGVVATYGGLPIPSVTAFMSGFYQGVEYFNKQNSKSVKVLGWNAADPEKGTYAGGFDDQNKGKQIANNFIQQGADVVFPVAGPVGLGTAAAAQATGGKVSVIWVDTDGCVSASQYCDVFLTSVMKEIGVAVYDTVKSASTGTFSSDLYVGTLANAGTKLAPYNKFDNVVPADVKAQVEKAQADIIAGTITVKP